ncbi:MAG TPA: mechanosensitive ion channel domain-containing protein [Algoriphagus sp.]|nr:mechanosensitive ion channel domain-containing protein [Algoriphagus sp.]
MKKLYPVLFSLFFLVSSHVTGQDSIDLKKIDSLLLSSKDSLIFLDSTLLNIELPIMGSTPSLEDLIKKGRTYSLRANEIMLELQESLDTTRFAEEIPIMEQKISQIRERAKNPNSNFNFRYVNALLRILKSTKENNEDLDALLQSRLNRLQVLDSLLTGIKQDDFFQYKIRDTLLLPMYSGEIQKLKGNIHYLDSAIYRQELQAARYQSQLSSITIGIMELTRYVEVNKSLLQRKLLRKEINYIWESYSIPSPKSIFQITVDSIKLNYLFLLTQLRADPLITFLAVVILILCFLAVKFNLRKIENDKEFGKIILGRVKYLAKRPFASVMMAVLPLVLFMFDTGSIALLTFFMYLLVIFSSILIYSVFPIRVFLRWVVLVLIFFFFSLSNLYWEIAYQERLYFQIGNLVFLYILWQIPKKFKSNDEAEIKFLSKIRLVTMVFLVLGFLSNGLGRFSLGKILSVSGVVAFVYAVTLYFFIKVVMEIIYVIVENKRDADAFTSYIDFKGIQKRIRGFFTFLAIIFWVVILLHNLVLSDYVYDMLEKFLSKERLLGATSFTFDSILLFAVVIYVAYILANNIAYFASLKDQKYSGNRTKRLGSSVLLIRLAVLIIGFFIAATAAQIPLDKVTIVLGALSVGIGFGLQTIINNLVSGVILAFERPIQIGDDIEVGNMSGQVKEVGIRASKILSYDGAEVVIPNGDLLSQSLINWTLSDKRRRVELIIGVAYDSDMQLVKTLIEEVLKRDKILTTPVPRVLMQNFNDSSVDFRILFWIETMDLMLEMRNEVMNAIFQTFKENKIEIPYPKQDMYIKSLPEEIGRYEDKKNPPKTDSRDNLH